jgi:DUF971 family protein
MVEKSSLFLHLKACFQRSSQAANVKSQTMEERNPMTSERWPTELRLAKDKRTLSIAFDDGTAFDLPAEYLRVTSPSAEVQGHSPSERKTVPGKRNVEIIGVEPIGNYAVKLVFDDMHDTGIYGWDYLHKLGVEQQEKWQSYLDELAAKGLSRDRMRG